MTRLLTDPTVYLLGTVAFAVAIALEIRDLWQTRGARGRRPAGSRFVHAGFLTFYAALVWNGLHVLLPARVPVLGAVLGAGGVIAATIWLPIAALALGAVLAGPRVLLRSATAELRAADATTPGAPR